MQSFPMLARAVLELVARSIVVSSLMLVAAPSFAGAEPLIFHASASGKQTLDQGEGGGNPFASSLIDVLARPSFELADLPREMRRLTHGKSRGFQAADTPSISSDQSWMLVPPAPGERRVALVLVVADYSGSGGGQSLPGAKHDAERIAAALRQAGFATEIALDLTLASMRATLAAFARSSQGSDAALIYTTGHGVEVEGRIHLLPGDYPIREGNRALRDRALDLALIANSARARRINLVFYGGCRDNPFGD